MDRSPVRTYAPWPQARIALVAIMLALVLGATVAAAKPQSNSSGRIVAVGDIHGAYERFAALLREVELVDNAGHWVGGAAVLVQTGDFTDRGPGVRAVMDLLIRLQAEAAAAGGRVIVLLGNHEAMNLSGVFRDVGADAYEGFVDERSERTRDEAFREYEQTVLRRDSSWRRASARQRREARLAWDEEHAPGRVEYVRALRPDADYGRWLRTLPAVAEVDGFLFVHGGITPELAPFGVRQINERVAGEIALLDSLRARLEQEKKVTSFADYQELFGAIRERADLPAGEAGRTVAEDAANRLQTNAAFDSRGIDGFRAAVALDRWLLMGEVGPLWFRGYARWGDREGASLLRSVLEPLAAAAVVSGHTPQPGEVAVRFDGRAFLIDTGMLERVYGGRAAALEIDSARISARYLDGGREDLGARPARAAAVGF